MQRKRNETRQKILGHLCHAPATAEELAREIGVSGNAVRQQMARLAEDGLVKHQVRRGTVGKPKHVYELTEDAEVLLSRAYPPIVLSLLSELESNPRRQTLPALFLRVGKKMAKRQALTGSLPRRLTATVAALEELGMIVETTKAKGEVIIDGLCCPISAINARFPDGCILLQSFIEEAVQSKVDVRCQRNARPHCRFAVESAR